MKLCIFIYIIFFYYLTRINPRSILIFAENIKRYDRYSQADVSITIKRFTCQSHLSVSLVSREILSISAEIALISAKERRIQLRSWRAIFFRIVRTNSHGPVNRISESQIEIDRCTWILFGRMV